MNLLKFLVAFSILLVCVLGSKAQTANQKIKAIRQEFQRINTDSLLKKKTIDDPEEFLGHSTDGGGELIGYFKKDTLSKIYLTIGLSYGEMTNEFYFKKGQLIFVYETEKDFPYNKSSGNLDHEKIILAFEGRYYFDNGNLINKVVKGKRRFDDKEDIVSKLLTDSKEYGALLKSK